MIQTRTCPNTDRWQALLSDSAGNDSAELEAHLAGCARCRGVLDNLAVGSSGWLRDAGRLAADTDNDDPELTRSVHRIYDVVTDADPDISLDFLKPSEVPGTIGMLGRYQVLAVLGRGATGIVLKALDPDLLRPVAVKVMVPHLATNGTARQRFQREARAAAAVSHDHVVTIHAVDQLDGLQFLVMEYVAGGSLQARLDADGPMAPREVARIGLQAANGLAAAHAVGLIHRDVKPANILLENGVGRVKLTDFGLARAADDVRLTQTGVAAGTPMYMSPEQARGEVIDHRSDLFSLGSVLYALLTGVPPFRATTTMGVLNRISNEAPRPIGAMTPDVPADLEAIIMQLLEKDPAKRFQFAAEVSVRLSGFLAAPPTPPAPPAPPTRTADRPRHRRHRKWWHTALPILAGILMVAVVLKFKTPSGGTLIVEVDDPDVKVTLDDEELIITGAGPQEVRLKPGTYKMTTTKDGKLVSDEFVTITRGDKTIVRVRAEAGPVVADPRTVQRIKTQLPDATPDQIKLMLDALAEQRSGQVVVRRAKDGPVPQTHAAYPALQNAMVQANNVPYDLANQKAHLEEALKLAVRILKDTPARTGNFLKDGSPWIEAKLRVAVPDAIAGRVAIMRMAWMTGDVPMGNWAPGSPGTHPNFSRLRNLMAEAEKAETPPDRVTAALKEAYALAGTIQADTMAAGRPKADPAGPVKPEPPARQALENAKARLAEVEKTIKIKPGDPKLRDEAEQLRWEIVELEMEMDDQGDPADRAAKRFQRTIDSLSKTSVGVVVLIPGPVVDLDKAAAAFTGEEATRVKRLLALRDQIGLLIPQAQKLQHQAEKAALEARTKRTKNEAGVIPNTELEAAEIDLKAAERALKTTGDALTKALADFEKEAAGFTRPAKGPSATEAEYKKLMDEYDALTVRLVKTEVGRLLATISPHDNWSDSTVAGHLGNQTKRELGTKLLSLRAQILKQSDAAKSAIFNAARFTQNLADVRSGKLKVGENVDPSYMEASIREDELKTKFHTEAIRGMMGDFRKLADEIDPLVEPKKKAEPNPSKQFEIE